MNDLRAALSHTPVPALLIGNGINRFQQTGTSSWDGLLNQLAHGTNLRFSSDQRKEMSNTEFYDILDLASSKGASQALQKSVSQLMKAWTPTSHHEDIVRWAHRKKTQILTVNFDQNLSQLDGMKLFHQPYRSDVYPWSSYFAWKQIETPGSGFGIWHPHGMIKYPRSIRLGLRHYLRSIAEIQTAIFDNGSLWKLAMGKQESWNWHYSWFQPFFFRPLIIIGFQLAKDETLMRWMLLERARLHRSVPEIACNTFYVGLKGESLDNRKPYFRELGIEMIEVEDYAEVYGPQVWA